MRDKGESLKVGWLGRWKEVVEDWVYEQWAEIFNEEDSPPCYLRSCSVELVSRIVAGS